MSSVTNCPPSDTELLDRWQSGERRAGDSLCARYYPAILHFFERRLPCEAFELTQQTFTRCCETRDRIREGASFRSYVFRIAHHKFVDHLRSRRRARDRIVDLDTDSLLDAGVSPSKAAAASEETQRLASALYRIPIGYQNILELHYFSGLTMEEIAATLDIPPGTVRTRLSAGRKKLLAVVTKSGGFATQPDERTVEQGLQALRSRS